MAVDQIARMMALDAAQQGGGTTDTYTKAETDELLDSKADLVDGKVPASQLPSYTVDQTYNAQSANAQSGTAVAQAIAKKPGEITTGKQYVIDGQTVTAGTGAEAFNDLANNKAAGNYSHAEGLSTKAIGHLSHAEGNTTKASGTASHAEGTNTVASNNNSHAEGAGTKASGDPSHAEGASTTASGVNSHAEGGGTTASSLNSHAEGGGTRASAAQSHAEGDGTEASGQNSHAEGGGTTASSLNSHAEGAGTNSSGDGAHSEGSGTTASGNYSHAEGSSTTALGYCSHAEGAGTNSSGANSHAEGGGTKASSENQHVQGKFNVEDANDTYAFIIGNGTADNARHNAFAIDWNGLIYVNGADTGVDVSQLTAVAQAVSGKISATDYATQTTGGTIKAWTTTDGSDTILHLATQ